MKGGLNMLVKAFQERVKKNPDKIAIKFEARQLTYQELDKCSSCIAQTIAISIEQQDFKGEKPIIALLFEHGADMIIGTVSALKAGTVYVPFDPTYPEDRLAYMLEHSNASLIMTNTINYDFAVKLAAKVSHKITILNMSDVNIHNRDSNFILQKDDEKVAYILYTSGSTGQPKGVIQTHRNIIHFAECYIKTMEITECDRLSLFSAFCHDAAIVDIYSALLSGASLHPLNIRSQTSMDTLRDWINSEEITIWHSVPTLYRYFINTLSDKEVFTKLRHVVLGGESVIKQDVIKHKQLMGSSNLVNLYGQSESSYNSAQFFELEESFMSINLGKTVDETQILILNDSGKKVAPLRIGEIVIASKYLALGYWKDEEKTVAAFYEHPEYGRVYMTGDLGRVTPKGTIEYLGRKDFQVKIRGYRVELGEIESCLLKHVNIKEAVVAGERKDNDEISLQAYVVSDKKLDVLEIKSLLAKDLPDYMIPSSFIQLESIPLTPNNKIDRLKLQEISKAWNANLEYEAPRNNTEEIIANIWRGILDIDKMSINTSFFELGGHSLSAMNLISKIHKELNVKVPINELFITPTIKGLSEYIEKLEKNMYEAIQPVERKEYYQLSSAQKRLYALQQFDLESTAYNISGLFEVEGELDVARLENAFRGLIERHESLRTSFELREEEIVQKIHDEVAFEMECWDKSSLLEPEKEIEEIMKGFIRTFILSKAPLFRAGLIKVDAKKYVLMYDMHHIISDGTSTGILVDEFVKLYAGKEVKELKIQYKDYAQWQNSMVENETLKQQETYWIQEYQSDDSIGKTSAEEIPVLNLPTDYPRPTIQSFEGECIYFEIEEDITKELRKIVQETEATLYMVLLASFNILLSKYSGQEDIIIGSPIAGRHHADLENIIGMFVNTLAIRTKPEGKKTFKEYLEEVKVKCLKAYENQDYQFEELVEKLKVRRDMSRNPLFDVMLVLQSAKKGEFAIEGLTVRDYEKRNKVSKFDITLSALEKDKKIGLSIEYCTKLFNRTTIERLTKHLINIFKHISADRDIKISHVDILTEEEKQKLLHVFNNTDEEYPSDKVIHELFEEQVEKTPDNTAVLLGTERLTYRELNEKANQLARILIRKGVVADSIVGIMVERSLEMIIGIIGVLKAGGAYLPIDVEYPEERIQYMLKDSNVHILLTQSQLKDKACYAEVDILLIDEAKLYTGDTHNLEKINKVNDLAYIIYTSGSTGMPKGVMLEHRSVVNYISFAVKNYLKDEVLCFPLYTSVSFDLTVTSIYTPLVTGNVVMVYLGDGNQLLIEEVLDKNEVDVIKLTPTHLRMLQYRNNNTSRIKRIIVGGEQLETELASDIYLSFEGNIEIYNEYGPTEATVGCMIYRYNINIDKRIAVPIGIPIHNMKIYILDNNKMLVPENIPGELYIAGVGLARGYLNRPELTAEKFVENPFMLGEKMYQTGDLARLLPDGNIEFLGRIDYQVKIRGFRIELGEIENKLLGHVDIKEVIVTEREDKTGNKYLCAYIVGKEKLLVTKLREYLSKDLPDYMIPSYFIQLDNMPLTPNGKVDRKALPEPDSRITTGAEYETPRNAIEHKLATIWGEILGVDKIGINDNFFALGGDSIKAIQVSAKLLRYQLRLETKYLMQNPTIKELTAYVRKGTRKADQSIITGEVALTPIQKWFFEKNFTQNYHWNHAVMLYIESGLQESLLAKVIDKLLEYHDILRAVYHEEEGKIIQNNRGQEQVLYTLKVIDLTDATDTVEKIQKESNKIQASINLEKGPLVKTALFKTKKGDHLLIVIHHLVIDGVSWRIIFEDLQTAYRQAANGQQIKLQDKTDSFKVWSEELQKYANSKSLLKEKDYWSKVVGTEVSLLPKDKQADSYQAKEARTVTVYMTETETAKLLREVNRAYNTEINDILLAALGMVMKEWTGHEKLLIDMEGHGRELRLGDIDITRTVGWFTTIYPVVLDTTKSEDIAYQIKKTKEILRSILNKGIGYGILRYLTDETYKAELNLKKQAEISFNYLGQFDQDVNTELYKVSDISAGINISPESEKQYSLDIVGIIVGSKLGISFTYNCNEYEKETIEKLAQNYRKKVTEVLEHCLQKEEAELTPSDTTGRQIDMEEFQQILYRLRQGGIKEGEIQDIYLLSPMQRGMLHHMLMDNKSHAYFEQTSLKLTGEVDIAAFEKSMNNIIEKYDVLRTIFVYEGISQPVQVVLKKRLTKIYYQDLIGMTGYNGMPIVNDLVEKESYIEKLKEEDKAKGFNLVNDLPIRVTVIKVGEEDYRVIWSFHHIIMDGWCIGIVMKDFFRSYKAIKEGNTAEVEKAEAYGNFIKWLDEQDKSEAICYWSNYLKGYEQQAAIPYRESKSEEEKYIKAEVELKLEKELTDLLYKCAQKIGVTLNTLIQSIWGILLQRYNRVEDVVFGAVVSGRPAVIKGVEEMVGLFINTIPVRIMANGEQSFKEIAIAVQQNAIMANQYDYMSLAEIQSESELRQNLIDHIMIFENYPVEKEVQGATLNSSIGFEIMEIKAFEQTNYDFNIIIIPGKELTVRFVYNEEVYTGENVNKIKEHLKRVAESIVENSEVKIRDIEILTEKEKQTILYTFNDTDIEYPKDKTVHELFEEQVEKTPDNIAVVYERDQLTYRELNEKANQLARILRNKGVEADCIVGIMARRSLEMIIGIIGILKAGGAYLPIDPEYPKDRIEYMLADSGASILLTQRHLSNHIAFSRDILEFNSEETYIKDKGNLNVINKPNNIAYVIYTSGTTGKPKGVIIEHKSICNTLQWRRKEYNLNEHDNVLQLFSFAFDGFVTSFFTPVLSGSTVIILRDDEAKNSEVINEYIKKYHITHFICVPILYSYLLEYGSIEQLKSLRIVTLAGEKFTGNLISNSQKLSKEIEIVNEYGPTENSVASTVKRDLNDGQITIGKPIPNTKIYIMDTYNNLQPIGIVGEICIAGNGLARGYLNRSDLTLEKFVDNPFVFMGKMYKTGDLARWLPDGNIEFLGRKDHQVKIRGFRIELEEIESQLLRFEYIKEVVVLDRQDLKGNKYLCAYIVISKEITPMEVRTYISGQLPEYMIPTTIVQVDKIPRMPNGKVDRTLLEKWGEAITSEVKHIEARNETEEILVDMYKAILGVESVGISDSFFDLGGNSLKATILTNKIYKNFNIKIELSEVFKYPTIIDIAKAIEKMNKSEFEEIEKVEDAEYYQLSHNQKRLWIIQQLDPQNAAYNISGVIEFNEQIDENAFINTLTKLVERHESFRTGFKTINGTPVQYIVDRVEIPYKFIDISMLDDDIRIVAKGEIIRSIKEKVFDLNTIPLYQFVLIKLNEANFKFVFNIHHIISDGWSMEIIKKEFLQLYKGYLTNRVAELEPLRLQYKDFAAWQQKIINDSRTNSSSHKFWLNKIKQGIPMLNLPYDSNTSLDSKKGASYRGVISENVKDKLKEFSNKIGTSLFITMFSAYNILLSHVTGQADIACTVPNAGREHISLQSIVGFFVNSVILINHMERDEDFIKFVKRVNKDTLEAFSHQNYPIEIVFEECNEKYPEIVTNFNMLNIDDSINQTKLVSTESYHTDKIQDAKYAINLFVTEYQNGIEIRCDFKKDLFKPITIERIVRSYIALLNNITENWGN